MVARKNSFSTFCLETNRFENGYLDSYPTRLGSIPGASTRFKFDCKKLLKTAVFLSCMSWLRGEHVDDALRKLSCRVVRIPLHTLQSFGSIAQR